MISVKPFYHRNETHIGLFFEYNEQWIEAIKTIPRRRYSLTYKCWYIPRTKESWHQYKALQLPTKITKERGTRQAEETSDIANIMSKSSMAKACSAAESEKDSGNHRSDISPQVTDHTTSTKAIEAPLKVDGESDPSQLNSVHGVKNGLLGIEYQGGQFIIELNYDEHEITFLKTLQRCYWHAEERRWICKATTQSLHALQIRYACWTSEIYGKLRGIIKGTVRGPKAILKIKDDDDTVLLIQLTDPAYGLDVIKNYSGRKYDKSSKDWLIYKQDFNKKMLINDLIGAGVEVIDQTPTVTIQKIDRSKDWAMRRKHLMAKVPPQHSAILALYLDQLIQERMSWQTIKQYTGAFLRFVIYHKLTHVEELSPTDIRAYLSTIANTHVSYSTINKHQSAIRYYYDRLSESMVSFDKIPRPQRPKSLPKVLSKGMIVRLFSEVKNLKHLSMIYLAYGAGLRSGEITNLKIHDIDWERKQIWVRHGKGNKDRVVTLADSVNVLLRNYIRKYRPRSQWLFEGSKTGEPYSRNSLSKLYKRALHSAGLSKHYKLHSLRHSYATHLLDAGTDVRIIKELLGHKDIKTTLIYTHISNQTINNIISPIDTLSEDLKGTK